jgi:hypothetical protein
MYGCSRYVDKEETRRLAFCAGYTTSFASNQTDIVTTSACANTLIQSWLNQEVLHAHSERRQLGLPLARGG